MAVVAAGDAVLFRSDLMHSGEPLVAVLSSRQKLTAMTLRQQDNRVHP
jgi:hypothetical protein